MMEALTVLVQILDEVGLGLELPGQLLRGHVADATLSWIRIWVLFHIVIVQSLFIIVRQFADHRLNTPPASGNIREGERADFHNGQKSKSGHLAKQAGVHI